jgi:hypothetical protein
MLWIHQGRRKYGTHDAMALRGAETSEQGIEACGETLSGGNWNQTRTVLT